MTRLSLERIIFSDEPDYLAIVEPCRGAWVNYTADKTPVQDERIDGHVILKLEGVRDRAHDPAFIAIPFSADGKLSQQIAVTTDNIAVFRHAWRWGGHREHVTLDPVFKWPPHQLPGWPTIHIYIKDGKIVDMGSNVEIANV